MKLSYKIFTAYLLVSFVLLLLVFSTIRIYTTRHFKEMEKIVKNKVTTVLSYELALYFQKNGNWGTFKNDSKAFDRFVETVLRSKLRFLPPPPEDQPPPPEMEGKHPFPHKNRAILYDAAKNWIAGPKPDKISELLKPILINDKTIGWLGFSDDRPPPPFLRPEFLKSRIAIIYTITAILFILAGIVSYLLSRHILAPVEKLAQGTKDLNEFKFDTRINVKTKDELGRLAASFNKMAETLENYEVMKKQWMVDISHELRTPLSILKGEIEAIQDGIRPPEADQINALHTEVLVLESIVNDLHLLSKADADGLHLTKISLNPAHLLQDVVRSFEIRLKKARLTPNIQFRHPEFILSADEKKLRQVFSNVLANNIKYSQEHGLITITDRIEQSFYIIEIEDDGPGVPPEVVGKLFDRLFRLDPARNRETKGSGLGLSICKSIITAHKGDITAEHSSSGGLRIIIALPKEETRD